MLYNVESNILLMELFHTNGFHRRPHDLLNERILRIEMGVTWAAQKNAGPRGWVVHGAYFAQDAASAR